MSNLSFEKAKELTQLEIDNYKLTVGLMDHSLMQKSMKKLDQKKWTSK